MSSHDSPSSSGSGPTSLGIDFGGSGVKAALVDLEQGDFIGERIRVKTPKPATPDAVAGAMRELVDELLGRLDGDPVDLRIGVTVPGVVRRGTVSSAANIDPAWIGTDADRVLGEAIGHEVHAVNDADAAGLAEVRYGAARGQEGLVVLTTLGTGIGTALLHDGVLVPNAELGHLEIDGHDAESRASNKAREDEELSMTRWAHRLRRYYRHLEFLFSPDLFVVGGGVSKHSDEFLPLLELDTPIVPAGLRNKAGIVGAALWAREQAPGATR